MAQMPRIIRAIREKSVVACVRPSALPWSAETPKIACFAVPPFGPRNDSTMRFTKMHGAGNDYVYVNCFAEPPPAEAAAPIEPAAPIVPAAPATDHRVTAKLDAKPARPRKRTAKPKVAPDVEAAPVETVASEEAAPAPKRRATRAKAVAPAEEAAEAPQKTTRSRKSAVAAEKTTQEPEVKPKKRAPRKNPAAPADSQTPATEG